jgi:hypothetical protein
MPDTQLAAAKTSLKIRARRAAKPPALAPEMTTRVGSARPQSASQWATVMHLGVGDAAEVAQGLPVGPAIASAAAVVDVGDGEPAAGEELDGRGREDHFAAEALPLRPGQDRHVSGPLPRRRDLYLRDVADLEAARVEPAARLPALQAAQHPLEAVRKAAARPSAADRCEVHRIPWPEGFTAQEVLPPDHRDRRLHPTQGAARTRGKGGAGSARTCPIPPSSPRPRSASTGPRSTSRWSASACPLRHCRIGYGDAASSATGSNSPTGTSTGPSTGGNPAPGQAFGYQNSPTTHMKLKPPRTYRLPGQKP